MKSTLSATFFVLADVMRHISIVCEARPDVRIRIRRSVVRIHVSDTAIRIRIVVRAVQHTGASACFYLFFIFRWWLAPPPYYFGGSIFI